MHLQPRGFLMALTLLLLAACASQPVAPVKPSSTTSGDALFPAPPGLQPQVAFWRDVYSNWGRNRV
ncbi:MAG: hypothetical protein WAT67_08365, partial [Candidatus Contendobacter sp.]